MAFVDGRASRAEGLRHELEANQRALEELAVRRYVLGDLTSGEHDAARAVLLGRVADLKAQIELCDMEGPVSATEWENLDEPDRRRLLRSALDRLVVHPAQRRGMTRVDLSRIEIVFRGVSRARLV
jgi:hypothetical protein